MIIQQCVTARSEFALKPIHFASNLLDPIYRGNKLTCSQKNQALDFIVTKVKTEDVYDEIAEYLNEAGKWSPDLVKNAAGSTSAYFFWKNFAPESTIREIAQVLSHLPASTSSTERTFSIYSATHTKSRNRLKTETASNLTWLRHNIQVLESGKTQVV